MCGEVIDEHANEGVGAVENEGFTALHMESGVDAGHDPLRRGLFVPSGPVDLPRCKVSVRGGRGEMGFLVVHGIGECKCREDDNCAKLEEHSKVHRGHRAGKSRGARAGGGGGG